LVTRVGVSVFVTVVFFIAEMISKRVRTLSN